jgi:hypothetical protein
MAKSGGLVFVAVLALGACASGDTEDESGDASVGDATGTGTSMDSGSPGDGSAMPDSGVDTRMHMGPGDAGAKDAARDSSPACVPAEVCNQDSDCCQGLCVSNVCIDLGGDSDGGLCAGADITKSCKSVGDCCIDKTGTIPVDCVGGRCCVGAGGLCLDDTDCCGAPDSGPDGGTGVCNNYFCVP